MKGKKKEGKRERKHFDYSAKSHNLCVQYPTEREEEKKGERMIGGWESASGLSEKKYINSELL